MDNAQRLALITPFKEFYADEEAILRAYHNGPVITGDFPVEEIIVAANYNGGALAVRHSIGHMNGYEAFERAYLVVEEQNGTDLLSVVGEDGSRRLAYPAGANRTIRLALA